MRAFDEQKEYGEWLQTTKIVIPSTNEICAWLGWQARAERGGSEQAVIGEPLTIEEEERRNMWPGESGALAKSLSDPFDYALKLRTGEVIRYEGADIVNKDWVHLKGARIDGGWEDENPHFDRGIDVRLSDIVWVKDAPYGS